MVEAIESLFVPVLVFNNKPGKDETLLKQFDETAWNNPVVRYLTADLKDVIERRENIWSTDETAYRMTRALATAGHTIPDYLQLIAEKAPGKTETAEFAMHCYWEGEAKLGSIRGVKYTRSGWRDQLEVVRVEFDPDQVDYSQLLSTAQSFDCASKVYVHTKEQLDVASKTVGDQTVNVVNRPEMRDAKLSDQKYYLRNSVYGHLPLSSRQAVKINAALYLRQPVEKWLSPQQLKLLEAIQQVRTQNEEFLKEFIWPDDDSQLAEYNQRLNAALAGDSKPQPAR
jgi:hypothetical protein